MTHALPRRGRAGFTLLEMVLATAIALVLLTGLYWALSTQLSHAQAGREAIEEGILARAILSRIAADLTGQIGATTPITSTSSSSGGSSSSSSGTTSGASGTTGSTSTSGTTGTTGASGTSGTSGASGTTADGSMQQSLGGAVTFNNGVSGDNSVLVLSVSRLPTPPRMAPGSAPSVLSDLRRISYWVVTNGDVQGLARYELTAVTGEDAQAVPPDVPDPASCIIAPEVVSVSFEYFDGSSWQESWDGLTYGEDGETPLGPPAAIAVTLRLRRTSDPEGEPAVYRQVIALPAGNNYPRPSS